MSAAPSPGSGLTLYHYWRSSSSWRVRLALAYKNLSCRYVQVSLLDGESESPEHAGRDPMNHVPVLELADGTTLTESLSIIEWLDETVPAPSLLPKHPLERARARRLAEIVNSGIQPLQNLDVMDELTLRFGATPEARKAWSGHFIQRGLAALEHWCGQSHADRFAVGDTLSIADLCIVPQLYNARRFDVDLTPYARLLAVEASVMALAAYAESHPDRFEPPKKV